MTPLHPEHHPHRRLNPLTGQWVLVSPHRTRRPWQGQTERAGRQLRLAHDPSCHLCPGNTRAQGQTNPAYRHTFVFDNDFSALMPDAPAAQAASADALFRSEAVRGTCRVICFSPRHDLTLADMSPPEIEPVVETWAEETALLGQRYRWVQVFENKGAVMGCSNTHPHGQIWASSALPNEPAAEDRRQRDYHTAAGRALLMDYAGREEARGERVVLATEHWLAVVPYWAVWPFETLFLPRRRPIARLPELAPEERADLAAFLGRVLGAYDRLFDTSFPYSMGWHGAPFDADPQPHWQVHAHVYPPLLRSATVKKFMVGYEMLAEPQRDLTPEQAARRLRDLLA